MDIKAGPAGPGAFPFRATVSCDYVDRKMSGASPKFACRLGEKDEVKVKFGGTNAEVYAEVAASRLLWAMGYRQPPVYYLPSFTLVDDYGRRTEPGSSPRRSA